jgi:hypothetical protein
LDRKCRSLSAFGRRKGESPNRTRRNGGEADRHGQRSGEKRGEKDHSTKIWHLVARRPTVVKVDIGWKAALNTADRSKSDHIADGADGSAWSDVECAREVDIEFYSILKGSSFVNSRAQAMSEAFMRTSMAHKECVQDLPQ